MFKLFFPFLLLLGVGFILAASPKTKVIKTNPVTRLAFGSCNNQDLPQPLWPFIIDSKPDVWVWLGDNIYGDTEDMAHLKSKYEKQKQQPGYAQLIKQSKIIGIWDDHDFGRNNAGKEYGPKADSKKLLLDFLDVPADAPERSREGAYSSHSFGNPPNKVKVILLDDRYFRDELKVRFRLMFKNRKGDILGEAQWQWLEQELTNSDANVHIIGNGIQIVSRKYSEEKWANFPKARKRLFKLIEKTKPDRLVLLSGDRHISEISKIELEEYPYPIYEITASGMTHTRKLPKGKGKYHVSGPVNGLNYGQLDIDWHANPVTLHATIKGIGNDTLLYQKIAYLH